MVYVIQVCWHIPLLCVQWKTPSDVQRNCPKRVDFYSKNKFEKLVHLVGFIIRISRCTITWASNSIWIFVLCYIFFVTYDISLYLSSLSWVSRASPGRIYWQANAVQIFWPSGFLIHLLRLTGHRVNPSHSSILRNTAEIRNIHTHKPWEEFETLFTVM